MREIRILACDGDHEGPALSLSARLGIPLLDPHGDPGYDGLVLRVAPGGLSLADGPMEVRGDLTRMIARLKGPALGRELLVRACRVRGCGGPPTAVDATAGLGEDALLLAAAGFRVRLFERNPVIAALLDDSLRRARAVPELERCVGRMSLEATDSLQALRRLGSRPDVVVLDPMFPAKRHRAASRKKLQLLQGLEEPCGDERALLDAALAARPRKVVVKRPLKGPYLAGRTPDYSLSGKTVRYDCIVVAGGGEARGPDAC